MTGLTAASTRRSCAKQTRVRGVFTRWRRHTDGRQFTAVAKLVNLTKLASSGKYGWASPRGYNGPMQQARQFSLAHLCLQLLWAGIGFGLSRVFLRPLQSEDDLIVIVLACACHGAWLGGFFKEMRIGAFLGGTLGMLLAALLATLR